MRNLAIVMPVFNEAHGIQEFINEIDQEFSGVSHYILVVNDSSTDDTYLKLKELKKRIEALEIVTNERNLGHGPSTVKALKLGFESKAKVIMCVDGDGQFLAQEMFEFFRQFQINSVDYAEGLRINRKDPWFRKIISLITRCVVMIKCLKTVQDANTPCRIYKHEILGEFLEKIPEKAITPNLTISIIARKEKTHIFSYPLVNISRRGITTIGSSWDNRSTFLPGKRLIIFCFKAMLAQIFPPPK